MSSRDAAPDPSLAALQQGRLLTHDLIDTTRRREQVRQRRLWIIFVAIAVPLAWFWWRDLTGDPVQFGLPEVFTQDPILAVSVGMMLLLACLIFIPFLGAGRSPHVMLRPSDSGLRLADVVGAEATRRRPSTH